MTAAEAFRRSFARELAHLRRSPWDLAIATWLPALLLVLMAWQLHSGTMRGLPVAVVDDDHSSVSREYARMLDAAPTIDVAYQPSNLEAAWSLARQLKVYAIIYIPPDTARDLNRRVQATTFSFFNASYRTPGQSAAAEVAATTQAFGARLLTETNALDPQARRPAAAVNVRSITLFNSVRSYEHYLVALVHPAILHLALCICVISAFGRELRDGTADAWMSDCDDRYGAAVAGKAAPYLVAFTLYGLLSLAWVAGVRGSGVAGSLSLLMIGQASMYLAYAAIGLLFVGITKSMSQALSLSGIYAGTSLAFSAGTFPLYGASAFAQIWSALLPYSAYLKLQGGQLDIGSPIATSLRWLAILLIFAIVAGSIGAPLYRNAVHDPNAWGRR